MATPAVTQECTPGSRRNSRKTMKLPDPCQMWPDSLHCVQSNALFPIKQVRSLDLLDGNKESPPEVPNKSRRTLMSPQECQIARCSPNQLEMTTNSPALPSEQCHIPDHTGRLAWLPLGNSRDSLRHPCQVNRNSSFTLGTRGKRHGLISSRGELIPRILLKR